MRICPVAFTNHIILNYGAYWFKVTSSHNFIYGWSAFQKIIMILILIIILTYHQNGPDGII